jgi:serine/threonine protein kinase
MTYCLKCLADKNPDNTKFCLACGHHLLLQERYRAIKIIGQGSYSKTFQAIDEALSAQPPCIIKQFVLPEQADIQIFAQEMLQLAELGKHHCIPTILAHEHSYFVQEFIPGQNLAQELATQGVFNEAKIVVLLRSLLTTLDFIHSNGVSHRNIKLENIIRRPSSPISDLINNLVLVGFGNIKPDPGIAGTMGNPEVITPQQFKGKNNFTNDLYSLGVICIHLIIGVSPLELMDLDWAWVWRDYIDDNPLSDKLGQILDKLVLPSFSQRYQSASAVLQDLDSCATPKGNRIAFSNTTSTLPNQPTTKQEPSYERLENLLAAKSWLEADEVTKKLILKEAGDLPYLDNDTVTRVPSFTINTIDQLWTTYSKGRFGFTAQKQIFDSLNQDGTNFVVKVEWRGRAKGLFAGCTWKEYRNMIFMLGAPEGHLPVLIAGAEGGIATDKAARILYNAFNSPGVLNHFFVHVERCRFDRQ